ELHVARVRGQADDLVEREHDADVAQAGAFLEWPRKVQAPDRAAAGREGYAQTKSGSGLPGAVVAEGCVTAPDTAGIDEQGAADDSTWQAAAGFGLDRKSTRLNSSHVKISYAVFRLKKKRRTRHSPA